MAGADHGGRGDGYGIEAGRYGNGVSLTPAVESAVAFLVREVLTDLKEERCTNAP